MRTTQFYDYSRTLLEGPESVAASRFVAALRLLVAKTIRGVADAAPQLQTPRALEDASAIEIIGHVIDQASIGDALLKFARDCEAGEGSAEDLIAAMFVYAAGEVLR